MMTAAGRKVLDDQRQLNPQHHLPWGGRSPRELTRAHAMFSLAPKATTLDEVAVWDDAVIEGQYRRFLLVDGGEEMGDRRCEPAPEPKPEDA